MVPWKGFSAPAMVESVVVFPAPFTPISATSSPSCTERETSRRAAIAP